MARRRVHDDTASRQVVQIRDRRRRCHERLPGRQVRPRELEPTPLASWRRGQAGRDQVAAPRKQTVDQRVRVAGDDHFQLEVVGLGEQAHQFVLVAQQFAAP